MLVLCVVSALLHAAIAPISAEEVNGACPSDSCGDAAALLQATRRGAVVARGSTAAREGGEQQNHQPPLLAAGDGRDSALKEQLADVLGQLRAAERKLAAAIDPIVLGDDAADDSDEAYQLPDDELTLLNILGLSAEVSRCREYIIDQDDRFSYGLLQDNPSGGSPHKAQEVVSVDSDFFGKIDSVVNKFYTGFLPGTPVDSCGQLPAAPNIAANAQAFLCVNYYERVSGLICHLEPDFSCRAGTKKISDAAKLDDLCVVTVRGTDPHDYGNIEADLAFPTVQIPVDWAGKPCADYSKFGCWAHEGFVTITETLMPKVRTVLEKFKCKKILMSGHSLGAGVALIMGWAFRNTGEDVLGVYSFEGPRTVDQNLAVVMTEVKFSVVRVTHTVDVFGIQVQDIIPLVPPVSPFNYRHHGVEINYHGDDRTVCDSGVCEIDPYACKCAEKFPSVPSAVFLWKVASIHTDYSDTPLKWNVDAKLPCPFQEHPPPEPPPAPPPVPPGPPAKCTLAYHDPWETGVHKECCDSAKQCGPRLWWKEAKQQSYMCIPLDKDCNLDCTLPYLQPVNGSSCCDGTEACVLATGQTICTSGYCPCGYVGEKCCSGLCYSTGHGALTYPVSCVSDSCCIPSNYDCVSDSCQHCCSRKHAQNPVGGQMCID